MARSKHGGRASWLLAASALVVTSACAAVLGIPDPSLDDNVPVVGEEGGGPDGVAGGDGEPSDVPTTSEGSPPLPDGACDPGKTLCGTQCYALDVDPNNCGVCGRTCGGRTCRGSGCDPEVLDTNAVEAWRIAVDDTSVYWIASPGGKEGRLGRIDKAGGNHTETLASGAGTPSGPARGLGLLPGNQLLVHIAAFTSQGNFLVYPRAFTANQPGQPFPGAPLPPTGAGPRGGMFTADAGGNPGWTALAAIESPTLNASFLSPAGSTAAQSVSPMVVAIVGNGPPTTSAFYLAQRDINDAGGTGAGLYSAAMQADGGVGRTLIYDAGDVMNLALGANRLFARQWTQIVSTDGRPSTIPTVVVAGLVGGDYTVTQDLAVDAVTNRVYFADGPGLWRVDADGKNKTFLAPGRPFSIAVDATHVYWCEPFAADGAFGGRILRTPK